MGTTSLCRRHTRPLAQDAWCFLRGVTLQRSVPPGTAGILPAYRCRQDAGGPRGRYIKQSFLILH